MGKRCCEVGEMEGIMAEKDAEYGYRGGNSGVRIGAPQVLTRNYHGTITGIVKKKNR